MKQTQERLAEVRELFREASKSTVYSFLIGFIITFAFFFLAIFSKQLASFDPIKMSSDILMPPSGVHILGTDQFGRDVFTRIICGATTSLIVVITTISIVLLLGQIPGTIMGYIGGPIDRALVWLCDSLWAMPVLLWAMLLAVLLGPGAINSGIAVGIGEFPQFYRVARGIALTTKESGFVEATKALGANSKYIVFKKILPRCFFLMIPLLTLTMADAIIVSAGLGFLGLGVAPPTPEWGTDLNVGRSYLLTGVWWLSLAPGLCILLVILGFNLLSEGLDGMVRSRYERG